MLIDHPRGAHDDYANALALLVHVILEAYNVQEQAIDYEMTDDEKRAIHQMFNGGLVPNAFDSSNPFLPDNVVPWDARSWDGRLGHRR